MAANGPQHLNESTQSLDRIRASASCTYTLYILYNVLRMYMHSNIHILCMLAHA